MKYTEIPLAHTIVDLCKQNGVRHIVISPGSRNAPLTIGFTEDPWFATYSIVDERSAAFFALGLSQQLKEPAAVVCTSGSALLNYYPAVSEAFYSDIPLVVISADRPPYRIDIGDGQTIRQDNIFHRHILYSGNLKQDLRDNDPNIIRDQDSVPPLLQLARNKPSLQSEIQHYNEVTINEALSTAVHGKGPVHLNAPFEEPLYNRSDHPVVQPKRVVKSEETYQLGESEWDELVTTWNGAQRKMVLVGVNSPDSIPFEVLEQLAKDESVIVLTETTSNLHHRDFFPFIDKLIAPLDKLEDAESFYQRLQPEVLLTFGGMIVSKKIKAFLRKYQPEHHWHIDEKRAFDTFFCLSRHIRLHPSMFLEKFLKKTENSASGYQSFWEKIREQRTSFHKKYVESIPFSDFKAYEHILKGIPDEYHLQLSNSSTIRYAQLFRISETIKVFCNRGTSGIDGSTSTAVGAAWKAETPTVLISGDLSFFYDSNGLWNNYLRSDFRIVIINNSGGGIFRILPGDKSSENFETYFETTHDLTAEGLCQTFNIDYHRADTLEELQEHQQEFYVESDRPKLLEIFTPRTENDKILMQYFTYLANNQ
ncbi:2-succinyl-5-enolpyruvyl-6-hydroxy-3-cyclohexene-1-carboxylate synthase [Robertkochia aurantiaca]|uniref:2-succinyl-5-enolpyruvyl-6-hydroxy-3- cyclohexene-1-carboxylate synthase n=1 Tax=Robertkochia aurantiaca TaxID=2873700 RepID=UPI001CCD72A0|nr:2-succinyl-5-enolpyruvyl-6-hydroxy-3-cyclohexene-1-carboxylate synthase [Robertkochia sp. 3YJGBD-33]